MAVLGYSKMLAVEMASFNITVNTVLAGAIDTEGLTEFYETLAQDQGVAFPEIVKMDIPMHPSWRSICRHHLRGSLPTSPKRYPRLVRARSHIL